MIWPVFALLGGLALLLWSADRFIEGAAAAARHAGMSPLLIGMVVVGFGTSTPELVVSTLAALEGKPGLVLGNAYGSNIANIGLILGLAALVSPIAVQSHVLRKELPVLSLVTLLAGMQLWDGFLTRLEAWVLLFVFGVLMAWSIVEARLQRGDHLNLEIEQELSAQSISLNQALVWLVLGLILLIISSRMLVWGAVELALALGISDLIIGLTVLALGTSLPELASSLTAIRKREHDIALGNVLGSNLFNTLAVVGIAGVISPMEVAPEVWSRDWLVMGILTFALFGILYGFRGPGRINRFEGAGLVVSYMIYIGLLIAAAT